MQKFNVPLLGTQDGVGFFWHYLVAQTHPRSDLALDDHALAFMAHCVAGLKQSKSQLFQDFYVTWKLSGKRSGYFVEFGAMDGVFLSNTYHLEQALDWDGILAEPFPRWHGALRAGRRAKIDPRCVWWQSGEKLEFLARAKKPELSTLADVVELDNDAPGRAADAESIIVDTVSLNDLLKDYGAPDTIDYLSIDTEGSELDILSAFNFTRYQVRLITVEHNYREDDRNELHKLLTAHGFIREFQQLSLFDDWYYHPGRV